MPDKAWEFRFAVIMHGDTYEEALEAALLYLAEYAGKQELRPCESEQVAGEEEDE